VSASSRKDASAMAEVHAWQATNSGLPAIEYVYESEVEPWLIAGSDMHFVAAARASTSKYLKQLIEATPDDLRAKDKALLNELVKSQHSGPFAHGLVSVYIDCPLFVWQQIGTHPELKRSRESARYRTLRPRFYLPPITRALFEGADFSPMRPVYHSALVNEYEDMVTLMLRSYGMAWKNYLSAREQGVGKEIARGLLPMAIMSTGIVSASPLFWLRALSVRTQTQASKRVSHVQAETAEVFMRVDAIMREQYPHTMAAFDEAGRISP